ncbi:hypothetical protein N7476_008307 [Penicillium atrosanguineum]|uniref:2'-phosphotransferase n=1 Tax=Penicillium atrosanguineum TaxID=1132637 RepID=A0A9W9PRH3_9EURO|nr:hypothetical protein N7526_003860 [Penicillium atrosanguineum]KAJ5307651.1 hypothetical protein N7476_008307 [Penicillium atrosanguineum]
MAEIPRDGKEKSGRGRGRGRGHGQPMTREVQISKALSLLLRHAAEKEGLKMNTQGYASVADVLQWRKLKSIKVTFDEVRHAVDSSDKKRFALLHIPSAQATGSTSKATTVPVTTPESEGVEDATAPTAGADQPSSSVVEAPVSAEDQQSATAQALSVTDTEPSNFLIRATQGHSIKTVEAASLLESLSLSDESKLPETVVHGTFHGAWPAILQSGGLQCMGRNHVHFATGPSLESVLAAQKEGMQKNDSKNKVISGMRKDAQVLIYIDLKKALAAGCPFWRSENGVILSEGMPVSQEEGEADEKQQKIVSMDFFDVVAEKKVGLGKIWERGEVLQELPANLTSKGTPKDNPKGNPKGNRR